MSATGNERGNGDRGTVEARRPPAPCPPRASRPRFTADPPHPPPGPGVRGTIRRSALSSRSDAGRHSGAPPGAPPRAASGFTLIELLVVVAIVAVLAVALTLSIGGNAERRLANEAERFRALVEQACRTSELTGREIGAVLDADGYRFRRLDGTQWHEFGEGELRPRRWPPALRLELARAGRPLPLATAERTAPQLVCFSSGELTPFTLTLALGDSGPRRRVSARDDGTLMEERVP